MPSIHEQLIALVGLAYAAPLESNGWEALMTALCVALASKSAALATYDFRSGAAQIHAAVGADPSLLPLYEHYSPRNPLMPLVARDTHRGFVADWRAYIRETDLQKTEYFNEYMAVAGYHHNLGLCIERTGAFATMVYPAREPGRPPFSDLDRKLCRALMPHLSRAFEVHRRLQASELHSAAAIGALDQLAFGVCVLDSTGVALFVNRAAREMLDEGDGLTLRSGRLVAARMDEAAALRKAIARATQKNAPDLGPEGRALRVTRESLRRAFEVLVVPVSPDTSSFGLPASATIAFIGDPERTPETWDALLIRLYGLTRAEAQTVTLILEGRRVQDIADFLRVDANTTRTHLKRVFSKTGARTQSDLVRLLLSGPAQLRRPIPAR